MRGTGVPRRATAWALLLLAWALLCGPSGAVMYARTTFLFAFSSSESRMVPIVAASPWLVAVVALLAGAAALAATRSLAQVVGAILGGLAVA